MILQYTGLILVYVSILASTLSPPDLGSERDVGLEAETKRGYRFPKPEGGFPKYFHEPGGAESGDDPLANHYDSRFYHRVLDYEDKRDTQVHMSRAYLTFFREESLETWLAHGTLLGWWWNGKVGLPLFLLRRKGLM